MRSLAYLSIAAVCLAACSETTGPAPNLSIREAKGSDSGITVSGTLTNETYPFDDGIFSGSAGGAFTVESTDGGFGAASPDLGAVYNNSANMFIGRVDNSIIRLTVPNGGSVYSLSFDLYIIGSWDGSGKQSGKQFGADVWSASIRCTPSGPDVAMLLTTTFSNQKTVQQDYPHTGSKAGSGSYRQDALGFRNDPTSHTPLFDSMGDTWYKFTFTGTNPCGAGNPMVLAWSVPGGTLQSNYDESWGIDNVQILTDP